jgi:peptide methionine sulfoxide reductase MsrB
MNYNELTPEQERVIIDKATEPHFTGEYDNFYEDGVFICRRCNAPLFSSKSKFDAGCGWPSFDGHEFLGEHLTDKTLVNVSIHYLCESDDCVNATTSKLRHSMM